MVLVYTKCVIQTHTHKKYVKAIIRGAEGLGALTQKNRKHIEPSSLFESERESESRNLR